MGYILSDIVEKFLRYNVLVEDPYLKQLEQEARQENIPIVRREVGQLLRLLTQIAKPQNILEVGTAIGYSTLWMAREAAAWGGTVTTIERNPQRRHRALQIFQEAQLERTVNSLLGDASNILKDLQGPYQMIFVDAAKGQYLNWHPFLKKMLSSGGILVADNVMFQGMVLPNSYLPRRQKTAVNRLRQYLKELQRPPFTTVILPLGDGVAVSLLQEELT
ncbi:O-methyltransferase [Metallumcola ferriviriculae]|uniref:tRNA 5-hydroxyuridine methyltransferase n=1 Tax=Metallumcola ferriviriculae TaxID=3039180 RepID=A0AAU0UQF2_9FIRM|nr:O-methyltransferase [Desulfitibacteraceae bacterium MK1]